MQNRTAFPVVFVLTGLWALSMLTGCDLSPGNPSTPPGQDLAAGRYTILLHIAHGANHAAAIETIRELTEKNTGWKGLITVTKDSYSALYWGSYATPADAEKYLQTAKNFRSESGRQPFPKALVVPVPAGHVGPPEWDLAKAKGAYTVCVQVWYNDPKVEFYQRKEAAVAYCKQLREQGYEAYYHHGPSRSSVTIGSFPASSVEMVKEYGRVSPVVSDPRIQAILDKFPRLAVNGHEFWVTVPRIDPETGRPIPPPLSKDGRPIKNMLAKSYVVKIPHDSTGDVDSAPHTDGLGR